MAEKLSGDRSDPDLSHAWPILPQRAQQTGPYTVAAIYMQDYILRTANSLSFNSVLEDGHLKTKYSWMGYNEGSAAMPFRYVFPNHFC